MLLRGQFWICKVIVGKHDRNPLQSNRLELLQDVMQVLTDCHNIDEVIDRNSYVKFGPLPNLSRTAVLKAGRHGAILRIFHGAGNIRVVGREKSRPLDIGDWAYMPPNQRFTLEGTVTRGNQLQFGLVQLKSR